MDGIGTMIYGNFLLPIVIITILISIVISSLKSKRGTRTRSMRQSMREKSDERPRRSEEKVPKSLIRSENQEVLTERRLRRRDKETVISPTPVEIKEPNKTDESDEKITEFDYRRKPLLHEQEQTVYSLLIESLPEYLVMSQVRLADILQPDWSKVRGNFDRERAKKKIMPKSVDFVICDREFNVVLCIEFDGRHHEKPEQITRDEEKDSALTSAGIDIWRWKPNAIPAKAEIRQRLGLNH